MTPATFPDDAWLRDEAGDGAFKRGVGYFKSGAVRLLQVSDNALRGEAEGGASYRLWFKLENGGWRWDCDCPAADGGALCKHLVAAVLTARAEGSAAAQDGAALPKRGRKNAADTAGELSAFLRAQPSERLADWLLALARDDREVEKRLLLFRAASAPGAMQDVLAKVLATSGFMDYRRTLDYAHRVRAAIEQLQGVLRRDLSSPHAHLRVLESLHEFGRAREALGFAEAAVKRFPKDARLRDELAQCLAEAGLGEEALEQRWVAFTQHPDGTTWDALKQSAGADWPQWREKALAQVTETAGAAAGLRVQLLAHDGALADAIALARSKPVDTFALHKLAERVRSSDPAAAAEFYLRLAASYVDRLHGPGQYKDLLALLVKSARCARSDALRIFVADVRATHARKTKLMAMLDEAGL